MESQAGSGLEEVEALLNATTSAPSFGLNSRELILRAAQQACSEQEDELPEAPSNSTYTEAPSATQTAARAEGRQPLSGMLAERLIHDGLTVHERPIVQYVPRSSIPRVARQVCIGRLSHHACLSMERCSFSCVTKMTMKRCHLKTPHSMLDHPICREWPIVWQASTWLTFWSKLALKSV